MQGKLEELAAGGPYAAQAYDFVMRALDFTIRRLATPRHLSGAELLEGVRVFALQEFGPMSRYVLSEWGVTSTRDVGTLVFDLVEAGVLSKTDEDSVEDFEGGFDFEVAFEQDYYRDFDPRADPA